MAKKQKKAKSERKFEVLKGFNVDAGRWEIGDQLKESDITPENVKALLEMEAIREVEG